MHQLCTWIFNIVCIHKMTANLNFYTGVNFTFLDYPGLEAKCSLWIRNLFYNNLCVKILCKLYDCACKCSVKVCTWGERDLLQGTVVSRVSCNVGMYLSSNSGVCSAWFKILLLIHVFVSLIIYFITIIYTCGISGITCHENGTSFSFSGSGVMSIGTW